MALSGRSRKVLGGADPSLCVLTFGKVHVSLLVLHCNRTAWKCVCVLAGAAVSWLTEPSLTLLP